MRRRRSLFLLLVPVLALAGCGGRDAVKKADILADHGDYSQAFGVLEADILRHPKAKELYRAEIRLLLRAGLIDRAYAYYRKFVHDLSPRDAVLRDALKDRHETVRAAAAQVLAVAGDKGAVPALLPVLADPNDNVRRAAAVSLGDLNDPRAVPPLVKALGDRWWCVRSEAAVALGKLRDPRAVAPLFRALKDTDGMVVYSAQNALATLARVQGADPAPFLAALGDPDPAVSQAAALSLAGAGRTEAVPVLLRLVVAEDKGVRVQALQALRRSHAPEALPAARKALADPELRVRGEAVLTILEFRDKASLPALEAMAANSQEEPHLRQFAAEAAGRLKALP